MSNDNFPMVCDNCGKKLKVPKSLIGKTAPCPACSHKIAVKSDDLERPVTPVKSKQSVLRGELVSDVKTKFSSAANRLSEKLTASPTDLISSRTPELPNDSSVANSELAPFMDDGQDPQMISKLLDRVKEICTSREEVKYMAVQQNPIANVAPDAVVLTTRRAIVFRQKILGRLDFIDVAWVNVKDIHVREGVLRSTLAIQGMNGHVEKVEYLPKNQARRVYRIGQEMEEEMVEFRRQRRMEENRSTAQNVTVNAAIATPAQSHSGSDLVGRLKQLKEMLDNDLISQEEFDAKKLEIMREL